MEEEIIRVMDIFKNEKQLGKRDMQELKEQISNLINANTKLMDEIKSYKSDAYFLCEFIRKNINTSNYMINNLLKKYERKDYEISKVKRGASLY